MKGTSHREVKQEPAVNSVGEEKSKNRKYKNLLTYLWNGENVKEEVGEENVEFSSHRS